MLVKSSVLAMSIASALVFWVTFAYAACPGSPLVNGTIANADQVMGWLDCKAPLDSAALTGNVSINAASSTALTANTGSGWSLMAHGDYATFLDPSGARGITMVTAINATRLYSDFWTDSSANPLLLGAVPNISAVNIWPSGNVGVGIVDPSNARLSILGSGIGNGLPTNSGVTVAGNLRINDRSNIAIDVGQYNPPNIAAAWIQVHDSTNQAVNYPLVLQLNGGGVGIGTIAPAQRLDVAGTIRQSGCTTAGTLAVNGSGDIICSSDARLKNILGDYKGGLNTLAQIIPKLFTFKQTRVDPKETFVHAGFIAQNVKAAIPQASARQRDGYYSLDTTAILAASVNAIKQLRAMNESQAVEIKQLRSRLGKLEHAMASASFRQARQAKLERDVAKN